jgi:hypothetical protein
MPIPLRPNLPAKIKLRIKSSFGGRGTYDDFIREIDLDILEAGQVIGAVSILQIDAEGALANGRDPLLICDGHSQDAFDCGRTVFDLRVNRFKPKIERIFGDLFGLNVLFLNRIEIDPAFRGRNIGLIALLMMMKRWGKGYALAVLQPAPLRHPKDEELDPKTRTQFCAYASVRPES